MRAVVLGAAVYFRGHRGKLRLGLRFRSPSAVVPFGYRVLGVVGLSGAQPAAMHIDAYLTVLTRLRYVCDNRLLN